MDPEGPLHPTGPLVLDEATGEVDQVATKAQRNKIGKVAQRDQ